MNNRIKLFGIIAIVAIIGFTMAACGDSQGGGLGSIIDDPDPEETYFSITYYGNGNTYGKPPVDKEKYTDGAGAGILPPGSLHKDENFFIKWNTRADGGGIDYYPTHYIIITDSLKLYAQWATGEIDNTYYRVVYYGNGGLFDGSLVEFGDYLGYGYMIEDQGVLVRDGYNFAGWNTQANGGGTSYNPGDIVNLTDRFELYAQWTPITYYRVTYNANQNDSGINPYDAKQYIAGETAVVRARVPYQEPAMPL